MNTKVNYPTEFERKIMRLEGTNQEAVEVNLVIPSITKPEVPFSLKVAVYDINRFPSTCCESTLAITCEQDDDFYIEAPFKKGDVAVASLKGIALKREGFYRFTATFNGKLYYSNPTWCSNATKGQIFWGDPHIHTNLSNCHPDQCRSLNFCFTAAKHSSCLDWASAADHVSNGRCEYAKWKEQIAVANLFNEPGEFVTLPAYEASHSSGKGGDNNVYMVHFPDMFVDAHGNGDVSTLVDGIKETMNESDFLVVPHHTTRAEKHGEISNEIYPGEAVMPVVEIHSKWGTSEYRGNPNPLMEVHDGPSAAIELLNQGLPLGFIAGTDSHCSLTTGRGKGFEADRIKSWEGMTAIFADKLDRKSIFEAIKNRQCYAVSRDRTLIMGTVNGQPFGSKIEFPTSGQVKIKAIIAGKEEIGKIELIRNGHVIHTEEPKNWHIEFSHEDAIEFDKIALKSEFIGLFVYYYIRVSFHNDAQAWSSPVWIV